MYADLSMQLNDVSWKAISLKLSDLLIHLVMLIIDWLTNQSFSLSNIFFPFIFFIF